MIRTPRRLGAALAAALVLAAAGCGGDDNSATDAYVSDVGKIQSQLVAAYQRLASEVTATSPASEDAQTFEKLSDTLSLTITRLTTVDVPDKVRKEHDELRATLERYRDDVAAGAEELASGSDDRAAQARSDLEEETAGLSEDFARRITEINERLRD